MSSTHTVVMTRPTAFEVSYMINPWMQPVKWGRSPELLYRRAQLGWEQLHDGLRALRVNVELIPPVNGLPDLTFPANGAVVLDRKVLLARFAQAERRLEEPVFRAFFAQLQQRGLVDTIASLPKKVFQEGAGDCLWDPQRHCFWSGFGQRSLLSARAMIERFFDCETVPLELVDPHFYHLDVALAVLPLGEVLYYPGAFSKEALATIRARVPRENRIEILRQDATGFCANIVSIGRHLFMTPPGDRLRALLQERGYTLHTIDLHPFLLAGGAAACLTLRLDLQRKPDADTHRGGEQYVSNQ